MPAYTFDNVKEKFPIGFFVWDTAKAEKFSKIIADVYDEKGQPLPGKTIDSQNDSGRINQWIRSFDSPGAGNKMGFIVPGRSDFQNSRKICIINDNAKMPDGRGVFINEGNLIPSVVYIAVSQCIAQDWLNNQDQFLWPNDSWAADKEFHCDCLAFVLFHPKNRVTAKAGLNHWIPFTRRTK